MLAAVYGPPVAARFLRLSEVAEELNISLAQAYALVRRNMLPAIKVGGRGQWRVERDRLAAYIEVAYADTRAFVEAHPLHERETGPAKGDDEPGPDRIAPVKADQVYLDATGRAE